MKKLLITIMVLLPLSVLSFNQSEGTNTSNDVSVSESTSSGGEILKIAKPYIEKLMRSAEKGVDFVVEETPVVIKQYLYFETIIYWLLILFAISLMTIIRYGVKTIFYVKSKDKPTSDKRHVDYRYVSRDNWLRYDADDNDFTYEQVLTLIIDILFTLIGIIIILVNISDAIKVTFFPKLYLFEQFVHLIR